MLRRYLVLGAAVAVLAISSIGCRGNNNNEDPVLSRAYQLADVNRNGVMETGELRDLLAELGYNGTLLDWEPYIVKLGGGNRVRVERKDESPNTTIFLPKSGIQGYIDRKTQQQQQ